MAPGLLNLEFEVDADSGISTDELQRRLVQEADKLHEFLQHPVLEIAVGSERATSAIGRETSPEEAQRHRQDARGYSVKTPLRDRPGLNHPTTPVGPRFLRSDSHWSQKKGSRIRELREERERQRREQEQDIPMPFKAKPVPPAVSVPRFQMLQAASGAQRMNSQDAHKGNAKLFGAHPLLQPNTGEDEERPFRARPVPWVVSAPLYDQMLIEQQRCRQERQDSRSRSLMRAASLPPRLEAVRARLCGELSTDPDCPANLGGAHVFNRSSTPVPAWRAQLQSKGQPPDVHLKNRPLRAEQPKGVPSSGFGGGVGVVVDAAENLARDVAVPPGAGYHGEGWSRANMYGTAYGLNHFERQKTPGRRRVRSAEPQPAKHFGTTEVPDFAALHERERTRLERRKYQNHYETVPEPFILHGPSRAQSRSRQPPPPKDPSKDWRWKKPQVARPASATAGGGRTGGYPSRGNTLGSVRQGHFSVPSLERPSAALAPGTTAKTVQAQQHVAKRLQERRMFQWQKDHQIEESKAVDKIMQERVRLAVRKTTPQYSEDKIMESVADRKEGQRRTAHMKAQELKRIQETVNRRPLLMEATDSQERARRRALFRVRATLEAAGVKNPDEFFQDEEHDELARAQQQQDKSDVGTPTTPTGEAS